MTGRGPDNTLNSFPAILEPAGNRLPHQVDGLFSGEIADVDELRCIEQHRRVVRDKLFELVGPGEDETEASIVLQRVAQDIEKMRRDPLFLHADDQGFKLIQHQQQAKVAIQFTDHSQVVAHCLDRSVFRFGAPAFDAVRELDPSRRYMGVQHAHEHLYETTRASTPVLLQIHVHRNVGAPIQPPLQLQQQRGLSGSALAVDYQGVVLIHTGQPSHDLLDAFGAAVEHFRGANRAARDIGRFDPRELPRGVERDHVGHALPNQFSVQIVAGDLQFDRHIPFLQGANAQRRFRRRARSENPDGGAPDH